MRILLVVFITFICSCIYAEHTVDSFIDEVKPYSAKIFAETASTDDLMSVVNTCNSVLADETIEPYVKILAHYWRASAYLQLVESGVLGQDYINNAKLDVSMCLFTDTFLAECYVPAVQIYVYEGNRDKAIRTFNKLVSLADTRFGDLTQKFSDGELDKEGLISLLKYKVDNSKNF